MYNCKWGIQGINGKKKKRDLKPGNGRRNGIGISWFYFWLTKKTESHICWNKLVHIFSKFSYISPELLEKNICVASSDLWALGCIIYQLYYKKTPFEAGQ